MKTFGWFLLAGVCALVVITLINKPKPYVLYRSSVVGVERIHIATFDADEGEGYNGANCEIARDLFQKQPGVKVRYWCEAERP